MAAGDAAWLAVQHALYADARVEELGAAEDAAVSGGAADAEDASDSKQPADEVKSEVPPLPALPLARLCHASAPTAASASVAHSDKPAYEPLGGSAWVRALLFERVSGLDRLEAAEQRSARRQERRPPRPEPQPHGSASEPTSRPTAALVHGLAGLPSALRELGAADRVTLVAAARRYARRRSQQLGKRRTSAAASSTGVSTTTASTAANSAPSRVAPESAQAFSPNASRLVTRGAFSLRDGLIMATEEQEQRDAPTHSRSHTLASAHAPSSRRGSVAGLHWHRAERPVQGRAPLAPATRRMSLLADLLVPAVRSRLEPTAQWRSESADSRSPPQPAATNGSGGGDDAGDSRADATFITGVDVGAGPPAASPPSGEVLSVEEAVRQLPATMFGAAPPALPASVALAQLRRLCVFQPPCASAADEARLRRLLALPACEAFIADAFWWGLEHFFAGARQGGGEADAVAASTATPLAAHTQRRLADAYVRLMQTVPAAHRDFFFARFADAAAQLVCYALVAAYPGSFVRLSRTAFRSALRRALGLWLESGGDDDGGGVGAPSVAHWNNMVAHVQADPRVANPANASRLGSLLLGGEALLQCADDSAVVDGGAGTGVAAASAAAASGSGSTSSAAAATAVASPRRRGHRGRASAQAAGEAGKPRRQRRQSRRQGARSTSRARGAEEEGSEGEKDDEEEEEQEEAEERQEEDDEDDDDDDDDDGGCSRQGREDGAGDGEGDQEEADGDEDAWGIGGSAKERARGRLKPSDIVPVSSQRRGEAATHSGLLRVFQEAHGWPTHTQHRGHSRPARVPRVPAAAAVAAAAAPQLPRAASDASSMATAASAAPLTRGAAEDQAVVQYLTGMRARSDALRETSERLRAALRRRRGRVERSLRRELQASWVHRRKLERAKLRALADRAEFTKQLVASHQLAQQQGADAAAAAAAATAAAATRVAEADF